MKTTIVLISFLIGIQANAQDPCKDCGAAPRTSNGINFTEAEIAYRAATTLTEENLMPSYHLIADAVSCNTYAALAESIQATPDLNFTLGFKESPLNPGEVKISSSVTLNNIMGFEDLSQGPHAVSKSATNELCFSRYAYQRTLNPYYGYVWMQSNFWYHYRCKQISQGLNLICSVHLASNDTVIGYQVYSPFLTGGPTELDVLR